MPVWTLLLALNALAFAYHHIRAAAEKPLASCVDWLGQPWMRIEGAAPLLICTVILLEAQVRLVSDRWWCTPSVVSALALTPPQAAAIGRLCDEALATPQHASEVVTDSMNEAARRIYEGDYDDDLLHATERLAAAQVTVQNGRRHVFEQAIRILTPRQRQQFVVIRASLFHLSGAV